MLLARRAKHSMEMLCWIRLQVEKYLLPCPAFLFCEVIMEIKVLQTEEYSVLLIKREQ